MRRPFPILLALLAACGGEEEAPSGLDVEGNCRIVSSRRLAFDEPTPLGPSAAEALAAMRLDAPVAFQFADGAEAPGEVRLDVREGTAVYALETAPRDGIDYRCRSPDVQLAASVHVRSEDGRLAERRQVMLHLAAHDGAVYGWFSTEPGGLAGTAALTEPGTWQYAVGGTFAPDVVGGAITGTQQLPDGYASRQLATWQSAAD